jgi:6-phosphogluconolactonase
MKPMKFTRRYSLLFPVLILSQCLFAGDSGELLVYFGTYTRGASKGIYAYRFQPKTGDLKPIGLVGEEVNPSFVAIHPNHRFLYSVSEVDNYEGKKSGAVTAFAMDTKTGKLTKLNTVPSHGDGPCYVRVDNTGKTLLVANYGSGSVASYPLQADGKIGPAGSAIQHTGSSADKDRQSGPHAHSINQSPDNRFAVAADLGLDKVFVYRLDPLKATLTPNNPPSTSVAPGSGPRHFAFHPSGKYGYVINEMKSTVTAFTYDAAHGLLKEIQTITTLPKDFTGSSSTAEVQVHPSGKFLYGSNRGHDSIAMFAINEKDGTLKALGNVSTQGKTPRNFGIDPSGAYLFAANQDSDSVVVFRIDPKTGNLTPTGKKLDVPFPVCVKFTPAS